MRKFYSPILIIVFVVLNYYLSYGQFSPQPWKADELKSALPMDKAINVETEVLFREDFAQGLPSDWLNVNENGFCAFTYTLKGPQGAFSAGMPPIASQTSQNGFMILDSELCSSKTSSGETTNAYLQTPAISVPAATNLMLTFQHNFRYCCSAQQAQILAEVSTDNINWTSFNVRNGVGPNNTSLNPIYQALDITGAVAGATQVWVRFRQVGVSHYWWMIDDIMLVSFVDNDLDVIDPVAANGYVKIPAGQQVAFNPAATVRNIGGKTQDNIELLVTVNDYLFSSSAAFPSLATGQVAEMVVPDMFTAPGRGTYRIDFTGQQSQTDMVPENNSISYVFQVTDTVYSRTGDSFSNDLYLSSSSSQSLVVANRYSLGSPLGATSVSVLLGEGTEAGALVSARIYSIINGNITLVASTNDIEFTTDDLQPNSDGVRRKTLVFSTTQNLAAGEYLAAIVVGGQSKQVEITAMEAIHQPEDAAWILNAGQWQHSTMIPYIDLNFGENLSECDPRFHFKTTPGVCGTASGSVEAVPLNGVAPYQYQWSGFEGHNSPLLENVLPGSYEVTITDAFQCEYTANVEVTHEEISIEFTSDNSICNTGGTITVIPLNGTEPFTYQWEHDVSIEGAVASGLTAGDYTVTVTDKNGCQATITATVQNTLDMPVEVIVSPAWCGSASGTIELKPLAGLGPYTFEWDNHPDSVTGKLTHLLPGDYSFIVTDLEYCKFTGTVTVVEDVYDLEAVASQQDATCGLENGVISIEVLNGQAPYIYEWPAGLGSAVREDLAAGDYRVDYYDQYGCRGSQVLTLENKGEMPVVSTFAVNSPGCGQQGGSLMVSPIDPSQSYTIALAGENDKQADDPLVKVGEFILSDLAADRYHISVINTDGCELTVAVDISDEDAPALSASITDVTCYGGSNGVINLTLQGGDAPVYTWENDPSNTTTQAGNLKAGLHGVKVAVGECLAVESFPVGQPPMLHAQVIIDHIICAHEQSGNISLSPVGGVAPYSYIWSNGYSTKNLVNVSTGRYKVRITDFHECQFEQSYTIEGNDPIEISSIVNHTTEGESDGWIQLSVSGGKGNISYDWSNGTKSSLNTGLTTGSYSVIISDEAGCTITRDFNMGTTSIVTATPTTFNIYPNPASSHLWVNAGDAAFSAGFGVEVFNILGERVLRQKATGGDNAFAIRVSDLQKGVYIIRISSGSHTQQARFIKN